MGLVFDKKTADLYEAWYCSTQGRAIEKSIERLIVDILGPKPGERVLDIGCGAGNHLLFLSGKGMNVSGLDASPHMIARARERLGNRCTLKTGIAEDLPFEDNAFDVAVLINSLEFFDDPFQALREAGRVAGRKVFVVATNSLSWSGLCKRIQGYLGDSLYGRAKFYNIWQLKSFIVRAYGRVPISWRCTPILPGKIQKDTLDPNSFLNWKYSPFGSIIGISAKILYDVKADTLPLKVRIKEAGKSVIGGKTLGDLNRNKGVKEDERSLFI